MRGSALALILLAAVGVLLACPLAAVAQAADPAALVPLPGDDSGSATCGQYQVSWNNTRSFDPGSPGSVTLGATAPNGDRVLDLARPLAAGEKVIPLWCGDLLGDGSQALGLESFSGGAHCCFSATVVILDAGGRHVLDADLGNGGLNRPQQLDGGGPLELPAACDVFAYFDDLSFAASPFLPLIYAYDGTQYVEATRQFPSTLRADVEQAQADLGEAVARPAAADEPPQLVYQEQESVALRLFGLHVLLGDADRALPALEASVAEPVATWLEANAPAARDALAQRYVLGDSK